MLLFVALLFTPAIASPEISRWKKANSVHARDICYDDDTFLSFRYWRQDSEPYCSSLLGIQDITSTLPPATSRTTTTTVLQAVTTLPSTFTVPHITVLETTTITAAGIFKRENPATLTDAVDAYPQPYGYDYVSLMISSADRNAEIASSVYSACSCLHIAPSTVSSQATVQSTRTISGYNDAALTQYAATVTAGTTTLKITSSVLPSATSVSLGPSGNTTDPSTDSTSYTTISTTSTRYSTVYSTGTAIPTYSLNITSSSAPPYPTTNASSSSTTTSSTSSSSSSSTATSSSTSSILPIATSLSPNSLGCPSVNNTLFTTSTTPPKTYQIQCYRAYGGPVSIGLDRSNFRECIEECSTVNAGFSAVRCYGVTWLKYAQGTVRCNLKSQSVLAKGYEDFMAASAVLLTGVPEPVVGELKGGLGGTAELADDDAGTWRVGVLDE
ncbi:MAG: hypothetical protein LQ346_003299 [Caloplaca aetnensis]|nr:MAG: hypothetical protein LQ346_003299 [Caloplaca aetnensis]